MTLRVVEDQLPDVPEPGCVYRLNARFDPEFYAKRTHRNHPWMHRQADQNTWVRGVTVGIAGCGGMGGLVPALLARAGLGVIRFADPDVYDESNINRQFMARKDTIGQSKALCTARAVRDITDDVTFEAYTDGICEDTVHSFVEGCDVILDEIELFDLANRLLLHRVARELGVPVFNCNTVGTSSHMFLYTPSGLSLEEVLGVSYAELIALKARRRTQDPGQSEAATDELGKRALRALVPRIPEYYPGQLKEALAMVKQGTAPIHPCNPTMAAGWLADRIIMFLQQSQSSTPYNYLRMPEMPTYLWYDAGSHRMEVVNEGRWWEHGAANVDPT